MEVNGDLWLGFIKINKKGNSPVSSVSAKLSRLQLHNVDRHESHIALLSRVTYNNNTNKLCLSPLSLYWKDLCLRTKEQSIQLFFTLTQSAHLEARGTHRNQEVECTLSNVCSTYRI